MSLPSAFLDAMRREAEATEKYAALVKRLDAIELLAVHRAATLEITRRAAEIEARERPPKRDPGSRIGR